MSKTEVFMHKTYCAVTHWIMTGMARMCWAKPKNNLEMNGHCRIIQNPNNYRTPIMNLPVIFWLQNFPSVSGINNVSDDNLVEYWEEAVALLIRVPSHMETVRSCAHTCNSHGRRQELAGITRNRVGHGVFAVTLLLQQPQLFLPGRIL